MFQEEEVKRGMALLDEKSPGWEKKVEPEVLDISSFINCPLGQVFGFYSVGLGTLGLDTEGAISHGFLCPITRLINEAPAHGVYNMTPFMGRVVEESNWLNQTWRELLAQRTSPV